jgi:hypothetical protein
MDEQTDDQMVISPPKKKGWPKGKPRPKRNLPPPSQPGDTPQPQGKRPACEDWPNQFPLQKVAWLQEPDRGAKHTPLRKGTGLFHDPNRKFQWDKKGYEVLIMNVVEKEDKKMRWTYRWMEGRPDPFRYNYVFLSPANLKEFADKCYEALEEWFSGQKKADAALVEYREEKKIDALGDKIRKEGIF